MEEPELIKMLKYILLVISLVSFVQCHPLVTEQQPAVAPVPFHHSGEQYSEVIQSLISGSAKTTAPDGGLTVQVMSKERMQMTPVSDIRDIPDDLDDKNSGGHKHVRQVSRNLPGAPPPSDDLGSLCSIFQFFLEPRRYSRCRVSNAATAAENERNEGIPTPSRPGIDSNDGFTFNANYHRPVSNEVSGGGSDSFTSESENREIGSEPQRQNFQLTPDTKLDGSRREQSASKRYDQLEELQLHDGDHQHGGDDHHHHHLIPPPPPMFPKSSLDRTTIIVPDRPCPRGERRDHKGYCRRIVRVRPSYQYGPPPTYGPSRPYRPYYYSRYVSVPTLQFFIPSVP